MPITVRGVPRIPIDRLRTLACSPEGHAERAFRLTLANLREDDAPPRYDDVHLPRDRHALMLGIYEVIQQRRHPVFDVMWALPDKVAMTRITAAMKALVERKDRGIDVAHNHLLILFRTLREQEADRFDIPLVCPLP